MKIMKTNLETKKGKMRLIGAFIYQKSERGDTAPNQVGVGLDKLGAEVH